MHKMDVPLPKARVSEVLGLLEILDDEGGHVDLYKLGGHWDMILTSLYPPLRLPNCSIWWKWITETWCSQK